MTSPDAIASGNAALSTTILNTLICPSDSGPKVYAPADSSYGCGVANRARTSYNFNVSDGNSCTAWVSENTATRPMFGVSSRCRFQDITDGTSSTVAICETTLDVYDATGRQVATLARDVWAPGPHAVYWDASALPPGRYLVRLAAAGRTVTRLVTVVE